MSRGTSDSGSLPSLAARRRDALATVGLLTTVMAAATALCAWRGHSAYGVDGIWAAVVAGLVCWGSAGVALVLGIVAHNTPLGAQALLGGTLIRTGVPLLCGAVLNAQGGTLTRGGIFGQILIFFLVALTTETLLLWRWIQRHGRPMPVKSQMKVA